MLTAGSARVIQGDALDVLKTLPAESVHTCVTSPPYWGLRDYGVEGQLGLEATPGEYIRKLVAVFREVKRVLRADGTLWLNMGDKHVASPRGNRPGDLSTSSLTNPERQDVVRRGHVAQPPDLKPKDLLGLPWRVAFALQRDGWYLRADIVWAKPNPMPESVTDRPTRAHEYLFLLAKSGRTTFWTHTRRRGQRRRPEPDRVWVHQRTREVVPYPPVSGRLLRRLWSPRNLWHGHHYYYDADAIREPISPTSHGGPQPNPGRKIRATGNASGPSTLGRLVEEDIYRGRNKRSVWTVPSRPFKGGHFAVFPEALVEPCVLAGTSPRACPACGAPWSRVIKRIPIPPAIRAEFERQRQRTRKLHGRLDRHVGTHRPSFARECRTVGWRPTCSCSGNDGSGRCVVLDPFVGSGTTLVVARRLGRDAIGIEISPKYAEMARRRAGTPHACYAGDPELPLFAGHDPH